MTRSERSSPEEYRRRAAEMRAEVAKLTNAETSVTKETLLKIAASYERLANTLDDMARRNSK